MLVCSSPQLIAAYHVLLRLLEPRHPPCALICFKIIQIFKSLTSLKVTRYYNFFSQYVKELLLITKDSLMLRLRTFRPRLLNVSTPSSNLKRTSLLSCSASNRSAILHRALVFERTPFVLVEDIGVEPMTPCLQSRCSSQLSYAPLSTDVF